MYGKMHVTVFHWFILNLVLCSIPIFNNFIFVGCAENKNLGWYYWLCFGTLS
uniref:Uncharacterized protein n=1 Tax=Arundo donax TaxID=35708 RepID=A0A0A9QCE2_ARUDO